MQQRFGFFKGMRQSSSPNKADPQSYYEAMNKRVIVDSKSATGSMTDEPGTSLLVSIPITRPVYTLALDDTTNTPNGTLTFYTDTGNIPIAIVCDRGINLVYSEIMADTSLENSILNGKLYIGIKGNTITIVYLDDTSGGLTYVGNGLTLINTVPTINSTEIIASGVIRDWVVLFTKYEQYGQVWKYRLDSSGAVENVINGYLVPSVHMVYNGVMYDALADYIISEIVGRYDDEDFVKIYWSNSLDELYHMNIESKETLIYPIELLSITPGVNLTQPKVLEVVSGGMYYSGMVQYGYQLYNLYGAETVISPLSGLIHLTESNESSPLSMTYKGIDNGVQAGKAVKISIENIDTKFDYIKLIAIFYTTEEGDPEVNVVYEGSIPMSGSIKIVDSGDSVLSVYTPAQLNSIGTKIFSPKTLTTKDNFLIAGNITDKYFDIEDVYGSYWDARAYRFGMVTTPEVGLSAIKNVGESSYTQFTSTYLIGGESIPETHDCHLEKDLQISTYRYQVGGTVLGGQGPKIKYSFFVRPMLIDNLSNYAHVIIPPVAGNRQKWGDSTNIDYIEDGYSDNTSYSNYASPINQAELVGYQRNEVYRFGIVFFDGKGRHSFVKWIGDIKMPAVNEMDGNLVYYTNQSTQSGASYYFDTYFNCTGGTGIYANALGIKFSVDTTGLPTDWKFAIVRTRREDSDRTVRAQGLTTVGIWNNFKSLIQGSNNLNEFNMASYDADSNIRGLLYFHAPETKFKKDFNKTSADKVSFLYETDAEEIKNYPVNRVYKFINTATRLSGSKLVTDSIQTEVSDSTNYTLDTGVGTIRLNNFMFLPDDGWGGNYDFPYSYCGSNLALALEDKDVLGYTNNLIVNYERDLVSQYGGFDYNAKQNNSYILAGKIKSCTGGLINSSIYGGDTFITIFDSLMSMFVREGLSHDDMVSLDSWVLLSSVPSSAFIPVESIINLDMRQDLCQSKSHEVATNGKIQETVQKGFQEWPDGNPSGAYPSNFTDYYLYNTVYSRQATGRVYLAKPLNFRTIQNNDCDVTSSDRHISAEYIDSWTSFKFNNKITINTSNGALTKLHVFRNQVMFWQPKAFGLFSFNDRKVITDPNGTQLILGVGSVLEYFQYISEMSGASFTKSIIDSGAALYWYDDINRKFMMFQEGKEESISDVADVAPLFKRQELDTVTNAIGVFDKSTRRVLLTFPSVYTISFNERLQAFESLYSYTPTIYIFNNGKLFGINGNSLVYQFGVESVPNEFFGALPVEGYIEFISGGVENKVFTNIEFTSSSSNSTTEYPLDTFNYMELSNSYASGVVSLVQPTNLRRRFRTWRIQLPRYIEGIRYLDNHIKVRLANTPTNNANLRLDDITMYFLIPML